MAKEIVKGRFYKDVNNGAVYIAAVVENNYCILVDNYGNTERFPLNSYHVGDFTEADDGDLLSRMRADLQYEMTNFNKNSLW